MFNTFSKTLIVSAVLAGGSVIGATAHADQTTAKDTTSKIAIHQEALKGIEGLLGNGDTRTAAIQQDGFDVTAVQNEINNILDGTSSVATTSVAATATVTSSAASSVATQESSAASSTATSTAVSSSSDLTASDAASAMAANNPGTTAAQWESVIQAESGGNPNADNGAGDTGLFQVDNLPVGASVAEQVAAATVKYQSQGWSAWPNTNPYAQ